MWRRALPFRAAVRTGCSYHVTPQVFPSRIDSPALPLAATHAAHHGTPNAATPLRPHWSALPHAPPPSPRRAARLGKAVLCAVAHALCGVVRSGPGEMFRRPPRNFRGRQRAASSGSSGDERGLASAPPLGRGRDEEAGSEESEEDRGGTASSSEGARTAAEQPLPSGEPVRGTGAVLSFGSEEEQEREGERLGGPLRVRGGERIQQAGRCGRDGSVCACGSS